MGDLELLGWIVCILFLLVGVVTAIASHEARKRKPNIRVPRVTSWGRAANYYRGDE